MYLTCHKIYHLNVYNPVAFSIFKIVQLSQIFAKGKEKYILGTRSPPGGTPG